MLDWNQIIEYLDHDVWSQHLLALTWLEPAEDTFHSPLEDLIWEAFIHGLPHADAHEAHDVLCNGWRLTRHPTDAWVILTIATPDYYDGPYQRPPWVAVDPVPSRLYAVGIAREFIEDMILTRAYPPSTTCREATLTILEAWDAAPRFWIPTIQSIQNVPCVLI